MRDTTPRYVPSGAGISEWPFLPVSGAWRNNSCAHAVPPPLPIQIRVARPPNVRLVSRACPMRSPSTL